MKIELSDEVLTDLQEEAKHLTREDGLLSMVFEDIRCNAAVNLSNHPIGSPQSHDALCVLRGANMIEAAIRGATRKSFLKHGTFSALRRRNT